MADNQKEDWGLSPEKQELFHKMTGCMMANDIAMDYNQYLAVLFKEHGFNYISNKCVEMQNAGLKFMKAVNYSFDKQNPDYKEMVIFNKQLIDEITSLPIEKQKRVMALVNKLKKEEN